MSLSEESSQAGMTLLDANSCAWKIYNEIQNSGAPDYRPTTVEPIDAEYRREIATYLRDNFNLNNRDTIHFIENLELVYDNSEDVFIATGNLLGSPFETSDKEFIAHEQGHRLGKEIIENWLEPLKESEEVSEDAYQQLYNYVASEDFAERTKLAIGKTIDEDFEYNERQLEDNGLIYSRKDRLGPDKLVETKRDENLDELIEEIERMMRELAEGDPSWT